MSYCAAASAITVHCKIRRVFNNDTVVRRNNVHDRLPLVIRPSCSSPLTMQKGIAKGRLPQV
jgi:hypothetical protein